MLAIYKRELKSFFHSFIGLLFIGVILFFLGLYFTVFGLFNGQPYFSGVVSSTVFLFMITFPILTMRILAEERKNKTDQLILTAPVTVGGIVFGKFLATLTVFAIPTLISCVYPLLLIPYGRIPMNENYLSIFAFFLYGMTCIAIGMWVSSITESQVIAAVISFAILFIGYMMSAILSLFDAGTFVKKVLGYFDMQAPFGELLNGTLNVNDVFYYVSLTALFLFLTIQSIQKRRYSVSVKQISMSVYNNGMVVAVIAIIALVNVIIGELPASWTAIDMTSQKLYSISDISLDYVKELDQDVTIYSITQEGAPDPVVKQTLQRFDDASSHITVEYIDPTEQPKFHTQYTDQPITLNSLIVVSDKRSKVILYDDMYSSSIDAVTKEQSVTGYDGEGQITSAIDYVTTDDMPKLYTIDGHGEFGMTTSFASVIEKQNVVSEELSLMTVEAVPEDADCVLINAPRNDFSAEDADKIITYLNQGGKVILITPHLDGVTLPNFEKILEHAGIEAAEGLIVEPDINQHYANMYYTIPILKDHEYTEDVKGTYYVFAPFTKGLVILDKSMPYRSYKEFMVTSEKSFSKVNLTDSRNTVKEEGDIDGPFAIGMEVRIENDGYEDGFLIALSCDQMFNEEAHAVTPGNQALFSSLISSFAVHEDPLVIPIKSYQVSRLMIPQSNILSTGAVVTAVLPLASLIAGFVIWFRRRRG